MGGGSGMGGMGVAKYDYVWIQMCSTFKTNFKNNCTSRKQYLEVLCL